MVQYERLLLMAEDELTQYSTDARKIEKLRQKIGLSVSAADQRKVKETLLQEMPTDFWGIAGLGLLLGISFSQPLDFIATIAGAAIAFKVQKWGWRLQAKRLVLQTLEEIEQRTRNPDKT